MKTETEMKQNCEILKRISAHYSDESVEVLILKKAAAALQLVFLKGFGTELDQFLEESGEPILQLRRG